MELRVLVMTGDGINCETETAEAFRIAGFEVDIRHLNDLISERFTMGRLLDTYSVVALPGGFSFGDDLESGRVLALKIRYGLKWDLLAFAEKGGLVIGICNGFQALIRMGVFGKELSITQNSGGKFVDKWVRLVPAGAKCIWLKGLGTVELPIRHGEGRVVFQMLHRQGTLEKMNRQGMICLKYEGDSPNGSEESIAGLCDPSGRIFGLMPHPEAFVRWTSHPDWTSQPNRSGAPGQGLSLFENAYAFFRGAPERRV